MSHTRSIDTAATGTARKALVMAVAGVILALPAVNANAQLEEVIVTAQKRQENLQDVAIAVSAAALGSAVDAEGSELWIGAASADITPEGTLPLTGGRTVRISQGIRSRCTANALALEAQTLVKHTTKTMDNIDQTTMQVNNTVSSIGKNIQTVTDEMAVDLKKLGVIFQNASEGKGTMGRLLNDPRLYETLTDTSERLGKAVDEFKKLTAQWQEEGVKMELK